MKHILLINFIVPLKYLNKTLFYHHRFTSSKRDPTKILPGTVDDISVTTECVSVEEGTCWLEGICWLEVTCWLEGTCCSLHSLLKATTCSCSRSQCRVWEVTKHSWRLIRSIICSEYPLSLCTMSTPSSYSDGLTRI